MGLPGQKGRPRPRIGTGSPAATHRDRRKRRGLPLGACASTRVDDDGTTHGAWVTKFASGGQSEVELGSGEAGGELAGSSAGELFAVSVVYNSTKSIHSLDDTPKVTDSHSFAYSAWPDSYDFIDQFAAGGGHVALGLSGEEIKVAYFTP